MPEAPKPNALILRTAGTNCEAELARAFRLAGAEVTVVHVQSLVDDPSPIERADLIGFPGGFSHGDDIASGRVLAMTLRERLYAPLRAAVDCGAAVIGVCNGFQVLVQLGLLPGPEAGEGWPIDKAPKPRVALVENDPPRFLDQWVPVSFESDSCVWTRGLSARTNPVDGPETLVLPIANGEGRFVAESEAVLRSLESGGRVAVRYAENPNGSAGDIAGICDQSGRVFGLMPHPERYLDWNRHPAWTRLSEQTRSERPPGLELFVSAVESVRTERV